MSFKKFAHNNLSFFLSICGLAVSLILQQPCKSVASEGVWVWRTPTEFNPKYETKKLFIFQGHFRTNAGVVMFIPQGPRPWHIFDQEKPVVLVYRLDKLISPKLINRIHLQIKTRWEVRGVHVNGLQIDYDSPTKKLGLYSAWLSKLRQIVPIEEPISITGLCDWLVSARDREITDLALTTDFIAFMMYSGTKPLKLAVPYIKKLQRAEFEFYIGLFKSQLTNPLFSQVRQAKGYRGVIVFPLKE